MFLCYKFEIGAATLTSFMNVLFSFSTTLFNLKKNGSFITCLATPYPPGF